jgi:tRNA A37 threonylcarbamoyladenosine synthetase subunit TsaC/SUA5/YrdC
MITRDRDEVGRALDAGAAVLLPTPTPLPYVVAGIDSAAVNAAKGRPRTQPTGVGVADFALVEPWLALDPPTVILARTLADDLLLNLFLPVTDHAPTWLRPASSGLVGVTTACTDRVRPLLWRHGGHLMLSSGNRTGEDVGVTAAHADAAFEGRLLVLDGDDERDSGIPCGSAAIVVVRPGGDLDLARGGIQAGRDRSRSLDELRRAASDSPDPRWIHRCERNPDEPHLR